MAIGEKMHKIKGYQKLSDCKDYNVKMPNIHLYHFELDMNILLFWTECGTKHRRTFLSEKSSTDQ